MRNLPGLPRAPPGPPPLSRSPGPRPCPSSPACSQASRSSARVDHVTVACGRPRCWHWEKLRQPGALRAGRPARTATRPGSGDILHPPRSAPRPAPRVPVLSCACPVPSPASAQARPLQAADWQPPSPAGPPSPLPGQYRCRSCPSALGLAWQSRLPRCPFPHLRWGFHHPFPAAGLSCRHPLKQAKKGTGDSFPNPWAPAL